MVERVFPTVNDIDGGTPGNGLVATEENMSRILYLAGNQNDYIVSGFTVPASDADLTITVAAGEAFLSGYWIKELATQDITLTASSTNYVYLKLTRGSGNVLTAELDHDTTGTGFTDSILLFTAVTTGSAITSTIDRRALSESRLADYAGSGDFYACGGAANAITLTTIDSAANRKEYTDGMRVRFIAASSNTSVTTINVDGIGVVSLFMGGAEISLNYIISGAIIEATYHSSRFNMTPESTHRIGAWDPELWDTTLSTDPTPPSYTDTFGMYSVLGNRVDFSGEITIDGSLGGLTSGSAAFIGGLPIPASLASTTGASIGLAGSVSLPSASAISGSISGGSDYIDLNLWDSTSGTTPLLISEVGATGNFIFSGWYYM